jgi:hypothetical protein
MAQHFTINDKTTSVQIPTAKKKWHHVKLFILHIKSLYAVSSLCLGGKVILNMILPFIEGQKKKYLYL